MFYKSIGTVRIRKHLNLQKPKPYICKSKANQHFLILNLYGVSKKKSLVTKFMTEKFSKNLNFMQKVSTQLNRKLSRYALKNTFEILFFSK